MSMDSTARALAISAKQGGGGSTEKKYYHQIYFTGYRNSGKDKKGDFYVEFISDNNSNSKKIVDVIDIIKEYLINLYEQGNTSRCYLHIQGDIMSIDNDTIYIMKWIRYDGGTSYYVDYTYWKPLSDPLNISGSRPSISRIENFIYSIEAHIVTEL